MGAGGYVGEAQEPVNIPCGQARGQAQPVHRLSSRVVHGPSEASWAVAQRSSTYPRVPYGFIRAMPQQPPQQGLFSANSGHFRVVELCPFLSVAG